MTDFAKLIVLQGILFFIFNVGMAFAVDAQVTCQELRTLSDKNPKEAETLWKDMIMSVKEHDDIKKYDAALQSRTSVMTTVEEKNRYAISAYFRVLNTTSSDCTENPQSYYTDTFLGAIRKVTDFMRTN